MSAQLVLQEACEYASEWTEMTDDPAALVAGLLANKVVELTEYIEYLERRLHNEVPHTRPF